MGVYVIYVYVFGDSKRSVQYWTIRMCVPSFKTERKIYYQIKFLTGDIALSSRYVRYIFSFFFLCSISISLFHFIWQLLLCIAYILTRRHNLSLPPAISSMSRLGSLLGSVRHSYSRAIQWIIYLFTDSLPFFVAPLQ